MDCPTASTICGSASIDDIAPSNWRPPWLDTIIASAPVCAAILASSASKMPLIINLPPQRFLIHSTSFHDNAGSNWPAVQAAKELMSDTLLAWPTILPNCRRFVPSMPKHQRGLVIMLMMFGIVSLGGAESPFFRSLWRCPRICKSRVSTSAPQLAALARSISRLMKSLSFMT